MKVEVIDASFCLAHLLPDENHTEVDQAFIDYGNGVRQFVAPRLLAYEIGNAIKMAVQRKRMNQKQGEETLDRFLSLGIYLAETDFKKTFLIANSLALSFYDAAYIEIMYRKNADLLTLDTKLKKAATLLDNLLHS